MNKVKENFVVVNQYTKKMEATFSNELDSIDYAVMLNEKRGLNSEVLKVDDKTLGRYLIDFRTDDIFLNKEKVFDTKIDLEKYYENLNKTPTFDFEGVVQNLSNEYDEDTLYLIYNKKDAQFFLKNFDEYDKAKDFVTNNLDLSKEWSISKASNILDNYYKGCDFYNNKIEFNTLSMFKKHLNEDNIKSFISISNFDTEKEDYKNIETSKSTASKSIKKMR